MVVEKIDTWRFGTQPELLLPSFVLVSLPKVGIDVSCTHPMLSFGYPILHSIE